MKIIVHTDGGARGNPGPAAVGVVIQGVGDGVRGTEGQQKNLKIITEFGKRIGEATNNVAEYIAVREALAYLKSQIANYNDQTRGESEIQFFLDSKLVVNQLNGMFKVKDTALRELLTQIRILEQEVDGPITYHLVPREQNRRADFLVNQALDGI